MSFFSNLFKLSNQDEENASWILLKKALPKHVNLKGIRQVYFLSAIEYNENVFKESKKAITENKLNYLLEGKRFDSMKDSINFYLLNLQGNNRFLCSLFSPYEFFANEYVLDMVAINYELNLEDFEEHELIYSNE